SVSDLLVSYRTPPGAHRSTSRVRRSTEIARSAAHRSVNQGSPMARKVSISLVATIVLVGGLCALLWSLTADPSYRPDIPGLVTRTNDSENPPSATLLPSPNSTPVVPVNKAEETKSDADASSLSSDIVLSGRVSDASDRPVANARIIVSPASAFAGFGGGFAGQQVEELRARALGTAPIQSVARAEIRAVTGADGRYEIPIRELRPGRLRLVAAADGFAPESKEWSWRPESSVLDF